MPRTTLKQRVRKLVDFNHWRVNAPNMSFVDQEDQDWLRTWGENYTWQITSETQKHHIVAIWAANKLTDGPHKILPTLDQLMAEGFPVIGREESA